MSLLKKIKKWLTKKPDKKTEEANRVTNYGGGGVKKNNTVKEVKKSIAKAEKANADKQQAKQVTTSSASTKATPPTAKPKETTTKKTTPATATKSDAFKATAPALNRHSTALGTLSTREERDIAARRASAKESKARREYQAARLKPLIDAKYGGDTKESRQRIKMGEYQNDPMVAKYSALKHPVAESLARGALSGTTFGASELLAAKAPRNAEWREAEAVYQANKSKPAEFLGEMAGSLAGFGVTGGLSKMAVQKAAPKLTAKIGSTATERLAANKLVQNAARKEAMTVLGREATEKELAQFARSRASKLVTALGEDAAINLTTGALSDVSHAIIDSNNPAEFIKNMGLSAVGNVVLGGAVPTANLLRGGARSGIRNIAADELASRVARNLDDSAERINILDMARKPEVKAEVPNVKIDPEIKAELEADAKAVLPKEESPRVRDMANTQRVEPKSPKTTPEARSTETPATDLATTGNQANESARTGERTEFRRDTSETAREQARNKRTANNRQGATKESFDKDFSAFEKKVRENQEKANEIRSKIRSATSDEERAALKEQLDSINSEVRREYNRASMRYHPDRGGSNEWMGKFNDAYDQYKRGSYSSRTFKGAESSKRARTAAGGGGNTPPPRRGATATGGGGNTPPPRRGATATDNGGFRRPKGKVSKNQRVMNSVEDIVYKRNERKSAREKMNDAAKSFRTQLFDSLSAFEDEARRKRATDHVGMLKDKGAIDQVRRHQAIANRSIGKKQVKWNGDEFTGTVTRNGFEIENGKSLSDIYKGMDSDTERKFDAYLLLKHAPDRIREGKSIFKNIVLTNGANLDSPADCLREAEKLLKEHPEFAKKAEEIYQFTRNELQNRVDAGLLSQKTVSDWMHKYPNYVPTGRDGFHEVFSRSGSTVGANDIKAAKGSDLDIRSIRDQLENATTRNWQDMTTNNMFKRTFGDKIAKDLALQPDGGMATLLDNTINLSKAHESGKYYADIFIDGTKHKVEIEKRFYDGLEDLYKNGRIGNALIDTTNDAFSKVSNVWKSLITEWSPIFMVKNFMRDFPEAIINSKQTKEFLGSMGDAWVDLAKGGEYSTALKNAGISQSTFIDLDKAIKNGDKKSLIAKANELVEMYPRLVEYMATFKKAGVDIKDADIDLRNMAAANAADVTVNFGRSGSLGKMINKGFVPFFNPSAQGWSKFVRNITELEGGKEALSFLVKATALGAGASTLNNFLYKDNPNYQQISARDKANNYIIGVPPTSDKTNIFIKIPRSRFASVYGLPLANAYNENKMGWAEMIKVANDQVAPIDPFESTLIAPLLAAKNNKTWYGTPIVSGAFEDLPKPEQYDANTSAIGKALGKATEKLPEEFQISPKKADYVIDAMTGVAGDVILPMATPSKQGGGDAFNKYVKTPVGNVLKKQFSIDTVTQNNLSTRFYDKLNEANTKSKSAKGKQADKDEYTRLNAYSTEISGVNKAIRHLQNGNSETKQEDIYGLQKVRNQLMQDALDGKDTPTTAKKIDAVQKYVGTTYAINNFGSSADKEAMKVYGASRYGDLSDDEMQKKIDADKDFYKGVRAIGTLEDKVAEAGIDSNTTLTKAIALASVEANDDLFGAYQCTKKSRTETADKMTRAKKYLKDGGSEEEYVKLEKNRKTLGKLSDFDKEAELDGILSDLKSGKISEAEYYQKQGEIKYNANISYLGFATSLAQANSPSRGYKLYDIKDSNIRKGINLAAMGFTARDYREMAKAVDKDGNGYPKKQEIIDYVSKSKVKDKATLFDALYYYKGKGNPFGAVTNYTRAQAADAGKAKGVEWIVNDRDNFELNEEESSGSWRGGYRYRYGRWHRWGRRGGGSGRGKAMDKSAFAAKQIRTSAEANEGIKRSSSSEKPTYKSLAATLKTTSNNPRANYDTASVKYQTAKAVKSAPKKKTTVKKAPPKVKFKKYEV